MKIKEVRVEFKKYTVNGDKKLLNKWTETIEFFEYQTEKEIRKEVREKCKGYEGYEQKTFKVTYKLLDIKEKEVEWKRNGDSFKRIR